MSEKMLMAKRMLEGWNWTYRGTSKGALLYSKFRQPRGGLMHVHVTISGKVRGGWIVGMDFYRMKQED